MRLQLLLGTTLGAGVLLVAAACSSGGSDSASSGSPTPSGSASGSGSPAALPTDAAPDQIAQQFQCKVTMSTTQSSQSVAASNSSSSGGGLGVPADASIAACDRQALSYDISTFGDSEGKQKTLDLLTGFVQLSNSQFTYCDGGLWIVVTDVNIKDQPTPDQLQKLERGAQVAHQELGCKVVKIGGGSGSSPSSSGGTITASVRPS